VLFLYKQLYANKVLGSDAYANEQEYVVNDFTNLETLLHFLEKEDESESYLTPAGKAFLKYYWGWDVLAESLLVNGIQNHIFLGDDLNEAKPHWQNVSIVSSYLKNWTLNDYKSAATMPPEIHDDSAQLNY
jgi:hypothetical protein